MKIYLERKNENIEIKIKEPKTLKNILKELNITLDSVILVKNNEICLEDSFVKNDDKVKILSVISGG